MTKTRVLVLSEIFPPLQGGSGRWIYELYRRLDEYEVTLVTQDRGQVIDPALFPGEVIYTEFSSPEWGVKSLKGLSFYTRCIMQLRRICRRKQIDEIHCSRVIHEGVTGAILAELLGIPLVCYVHGECVETAATSREQSLLVKLVGKHSRLWVCNSENSKRIVKEHNFCAEHKCVVLHPGYDEQQFIPQPPDIGFRQQMQWQDRLVLLTVGRLQQRKGQDFMIQAMPALLQQFPNLLYVIVGRGECEQPLRHHVAELQLEHAVQIHTDLDDRQLTQCYQQCDLFILPNRTIANDIEGFGMVLVEAQACGKAVLAGNSGGTKEALADGKTGAIIRADSVSNLTIDVIQYLAQAMHQQHQQQAADFVQQRFGWQQHVARFRHLVAVDDSGRATDVSSAKQ